MSRRRRAEKREPLPDARFGDVMVAKFINTIMIDGKKSIAERIVYGAFDTIAKLAEDGSALTAFKEAVRNIEPQVEVRARRVGGATYQVPVEVRPARARALAFRWLIDNAKRRSENTMTTRLAGELSDAFRQRGGAVKKREDTHKMAEANRAFSHYRW